MGGEVMFKVAPGTFLCCVLSMQVRGPCIYMNRIQQQVNRFIICVSRCSVQVSSKNMVKFNSLRRKIIKSKWYSWKN